MLAEQVAADGQVRAPPMSVPIVVTGATGFIGWHVATALVAQGQRVLALHRGGAPPTLPGVEWSTFDDWHAARAPAAALVHAAGVRHRHGVPSEEYGRQNIALTRALVDAAGGRVDRFVYVSSIAVYGWPRSLPIDEHTPFAPVGPYGQSKVQAEQIVRAAGVPYAIVRPSITYGPGDTHGMIDKLFRTLRSGIYRGIGDGRSRVQLVYVEDLAQAIVAAALRPELAGQEFICTYRDPITIAELSELAARAISRRAPRLHVPLPVARALAVLCEALERCGVPFPGGEPPLTREKLQTVTVDRAYRIDHLRWLLDWEPAVDYRHGLGQTAAALGLAPGGR